MTEDDIDDDVADLMMEYGPDGHCDGHGVIAHYVWMMLKGLSPDEAMGAARNYAKTHPW